MVDASISHAVWHIMPRGGGGCLCHPLVVQKCKKVSFSGINRQLDFAIQHADLTDLACRSSHLHWMSLEP